MKILSSLVLTAGLLFGSVAQANIMVWLEQGNQPTGTGDEVSLTLMVGGLGDFAPESLGAFDLDINFNSDVLSLVSYNLLDNLGDLDLFEAEETGFGLTALGTLNLAAVSYLFAMELDELQPAMFALADLVFSVDSLNFGESTAVSVDVIEFVDAEFSQDPLVVDPVNDVNITAVPSPAPQLLLGMALLGVFVRKIKN